MAELQDELVDVGEMEAESAKQETVEDKAVAKEPVDDLPEEFKGKSPSEIAKVALHARREMGRQANELGEMRKLTDELIKSQLQVKPKDEKPAEVDFFENPQEAIRRAVESSPKVLAAEQYAQFAQKEIAVSKLKSSHPDYKEVVSDNGFVEWVKASPIRQRLLQQADSYDFDAANELLSTFKELKGVREKQITEVEKTARDKTLKAASVDTGGTGESSKKVYSRLQLITKQVRDPAWFDAHREEIDAAYREGRIRP